MADRAIQIDPPAVLWLRRLALLGFTVLAVWLGVRLVLALAAPDSRWQPVDLAAPQAAQIASAAEYDFSTNPFSAGEETPEELPPADIGVDAPETTLNLVLNGLRAGPSGAAYIRTPDGQEDTYYRDEEIQNRVFLRDVFADHVLIDVNGQLQRLTLEDAKQARATGGVSARPGANRQPALSTLRALDAETLMGQVNIEPVVDANANRIGVRLSPRSSAVDLTNYGLRRGDVITRFAGQSLTSGLPDVNALRRATSRGGPISVDLLRDGAPMTITIGGPA